MTQEPVFVKDALDSGRIQATFRVYIPQNAGNGSVVKPVCTENAVNGFRQRLLFRIQFPHDVILLFYAVVHEDAYHLVIRQGGAAGFFDSRIPIAPDRSEQQDDDNENNSDDRVGGQEAGPCLYAMDCCFSGPFKPVLRCRLHALDGLILQGFDRAYSALYLILGRFDGLDFVCGFIEQSPSGLQSCFSGICGFFLNLVFPFLLYEVP